jgi:hypothetical protein
LGSTTIWLPIVCALLPGLAIDLKAAARNPARALACSLGATMRCQVAYT